MKKRIYLYAEILLLIWFGFFTFINADVQSLWADELSSIGYIRNGLSLKEMFSTYLFLDTNLPFYSTILYIWYRIFPYGEQFLLIPSILFCAGGIIFLAASVSQLKGERAGFIALCLGCSSNAIIWQGAWEARCYSLVFLLSAFTMWAYVNKMLNASRKNLFIYGLAVTLFLWTHWFACILLAFYGLSDLSMIIRKRCSWKTLFCYPVGLLSYCPWLVVSFMSKRHELEDFWTEVPKWKNMPWTVLFFLSGRRILWYICLIMGALICVKAMINLISKSAEKSPVIDLGCIFTISIGGVIGTVFFYSAYINPQGSLYVERYFMVIAPQILMITAWGIDCLITMADKSLLYLNSKYNWIKKAIPIAARGIVALGLCIYWVLCYKEAYVSIRKPREEFRQLSDYLLEDGGIWNDNAVLVGSNRYCVLDGFVDYYFVKRGYEEPYNIVDGEIHQEAESRFYKNYKQWPMENLLEFEWMYCLKIHMGYDDELREFLDENYQLMLIDDGMGIEVWKKTDKN